MIIAAVLTVSDSCARGERVDRSGPATAELLRDTGFDVRFQETVPDDQPTIEAALVRLSEQAQLVVTTGGTGIAVRDITPEVTRAVCSKLIEGIAEKMRSEGLAYTPRAVLSRGVCGVRNTSIILNLPGSPDGALQSLRAVVEMIPHAIDLLAGKAEHEADSHS
jgi:molybdopterin adenylyltransferase